MDLLMQGKLRCPWRAAGGGRHGLKLAVERLLQERLLQFLQGGELAFVEAGEAFGFGSKRSEANDDSLLFGERVKWNL